MVLKLISALRRENAAAKLNAVIWILIFFMTLSVERAPMLYRLFITANAKSDVLLLSHIMDKDENPSSTYQSLYKMLISLFLSTGIDNRIFEFFLV